MKKIQYMLLTLATFLISLCAFAQAKMTIEKKDGTQLSFKVSEISKISWSEGSDDTSGNAPGKAVDLGLPSGLKWASCNVGATSPEQYGDYFAWGETTPKQNYNTDNYFDKYESLYNIYGGMTTLAPEDDAAHANWGGHGECQRMLRLKNFKTIVIGAGLLVTMVQALEAT